MNQMTTNLETELVPVSGSTMQAKTVSNVAISLDDLPAGTTHVMISIDGANVRYRLDGTAPTSTVGLIFGQGTVMFRKETAIAAQFIRATASDAKLHAQPMTKNAGA